MVSIAAIRSSTTTSRAVVQRLISTSAGAVARPVTSSSSAQADTRKIAFVGSIVVASYIMKPSMPSASCDSRIPMEQQQPKAPSSVAPFTQLFGPDQRLSRFQREAVGVPLRLTFVQNLALTNTKGIRNVGAF